MTTDGGGWQRIDNHTPHAFGRECQEGLIDDDTGLIRLMAGNGTYGSTIHGGCGLWTTRAFSYRYLRLSGLVGHTEYHNGNYFCDPELAAFTLPMIEPTDDYYPGWEPQCVSNCTYYSYNCDPKVSCNITFRRYVIAPDPPFAGGLADGTFDTGAMRLGYVQFGVNSFLSYVWEAQGIIMIR